MFLTICFYEMRFYSHKKQQFICLWDFYLHHKVRLIALFTNLNVLHFIENK